MQTSPSNLKPNRGATLLRALAITLASAIVPVGTASAEMKTDIAIGHGPDAPTSIHAIVGLHKGYFEEEGLNVEMKKFAAGLVQLEALAAGNLDFAVPAQAPVFSLRSAGIPVVVVSNVATLKEALSLVMRTDLEVKMPSDLEGKKIAMFKGSTAELMYRAILKEHGVDPTKVQSVNMKPPEQLAGLASKSIDGAVVWEPFVSRAVKEAGAEKIHTGGTSLFADTHGKKILVDWTRTILTTLEPLVEKHPETVDAVVRVFVKAQDYISDPANLDEVVRVFSEFQGQNESDNLALMPQFDFNLRLDDGYLAGMNEPLDFLVTIGRIKKRIDVLEYTYTKPLMNARPEWVTVQSKSKL